MHAWPSSLSRRMLCQLPRKAFEQMTATLLLMRLPARVTSPHQRDARYSAKWIRLFRSTFHRRLQPLTVRDGLLDANLKISQGWAYRPKWQLNDAVA